MSDAVACLIGRQLVQLAASWHVHEGRRSDAPVDVWLIDDQGASTHIMSGTDWTTSAAWAVRQPLGELHHRHHREHARGEARPAPGTPQRNPPPGTARPVRHGPAATRSSRQRPSGTGPVTGAGDAVQVGSVLGGQAHRDVGVRVLSLFARVVPGARIRLRAPERALPGGVEGGVLGAGPGVRTAVGEPGLRLDSASR